jgi:hypothetical protein
MIRVNYREVVDRFSHIDAQFERFHWDTREGTASYTVRFYPWWEHPAFLEARDRNEPWGFRDYGEGIRSVTVWAIEPIECSIEGWDEGSDVVDWLFTDDDPTLWDFEPTKSIFLNELPDPRAFIDALRQARSDIPAKYLWGISERLRQFRAPMSLGDYPFSLTGLVHEALTELNVPAFMPEPWHARDLYAPIVLFKADNGHIVASDFEVEFPEFEHRPEWFDPDPR